MTFAARIEGAAGDPEALQALRKELIDSTDPAMLDALWRQRPVEATRSWSEGMEARRQLARIHDWPPDRRPRLDFKPDFNGDLWMYAPASSDDPVSWRVVVHPAPGLTRHAEFARAVDVRWYDEPLDGEVPCWFTYDRDCFIEILAPGNEHPYFVRRTQSSFGRWRVRRSPQPS
jgi:hypothetical protein